MEEELLEAKKRLYSLLIKSSFDDMTDNEIDIMYLLSKDEKIQELLNKNK